MGGMQYFAWPSKGLFFLNANIWNVDLKDLEVFNCSDDT